MNHFPQHLLQRVRIVRQRCKIDLHIGNMFDALASLASARQFRSQVACNRPPLTPFE
jgi:hypothetical protein